MYTATAMLASAADISKVHRAGSRHPQGAMFSKATNKFDSNGLERKFRKEFIENYSRIVNMASQQMSWR